MRLRVHFNLHRRIWSIVALEGPQKGRVIDHQPFVTLTDCTFRISETARLRVIERRCRSVHAWVVGTLGEPLEAPPAGAVDITYNPYRAGTFTVRATGAPITAARVVWFIGERAYARLDPADPGLLL